MGLIKMYTPSHRLSILNRTSAGDLEIYGRAEFISHPALHLFTSLNSFFLHWALFRGAVHEASLNLDSWFIASCKLKVGGLLERREIQIG